MISREVARRYLAIHHFLAPPRSLPAGPDGIRTVFDRFGSIQFDPIEVAGRNHDLVLLARVPGYRREMTDRLLYEERSLVEMYNKGLSIVPTSELPWYRIAWDRARLRHDGGAFDEHAPLVEELLARGADRGTHVLDRHRTTGGDRLVLASDQPGPGALRGAGRGRILGLARRDGNRRVYDLVERLFPAEILDRIEPPREAFRHKLLSRYRAHGMLGRTGTQELWFGTSPHGSISGLDGDLPFAAPGARCCTRSSSRRAR